MRARNASRDFERQMKCTIALDPKDISLVDVRVCTPKPQSLKSHASKRVGKYRAHISRSFPRWIFPSPRNRSYSQPCSRRAFGFESSLCGFIRPKSSMSKWKFKREYLVKRKIYYIRSLTRRNVSLNISSRIYYSVIDSCWIREMDGGGLR